MLPNIVLYNENKDYVVLDRSIKIHKRTENYVILL